MTLPPVLVRACQRIEDTHGPLEANIAVTLNACITAYNALDHQATMNIYGLCDDLVTLAIDQHAQPRVCEAALFAPFYQCLLPQSTLLIKEAACAPLLKQFSSLLNLEPLLYHQTDLSQKQSDQLRKMLLAMAGDTRVIFLTLLYQLALLRQCKGADAATQQHHATLVQEVYAPLANRLGMGHIKWQLEDWAFRYNNPEAYQEIKSALNMRRADRDQYVKTMQQTIVALVEQHQMNDTSISGRAKHIYSIYKKCSRKEVAYDALYDTIALRILTTSIDDCYTLLSAIHNHFTPIPAEFDDYISNPKPNGYQSIHTAILGPNGHRVEIQMRTHTMHQQAEHGACAHWVYKENGQTEKENYEAKIAHLRQLLEWQQSLQETTPEHPIEASTAISDLFADRVYVFSPQGRIFDLPKGSTALDFAYSIHTDIGHRTRGALINGKLMPLQHPLCNGDQITIQLKKDPHPSRDWLNPELQFLKSNQAKKKVNHWFRQQYQKEHLNKGQTTWEKCWRAKKLDKHVLDKVYKHFNFKSVDSLLIALGSNDISTAAIINQLKVMEQVATPHQHQDVTDTTIHTIKPLTHSNRSPIEVAGNHGLLTSIARCCKPIPGDDVKAYITASRGMMIHRSKCKNLLRAFQKKPDKILPAIWSSGDQQVFQASLYIDFNDRPGVIHDITSLCAQYHLSIEHIKAAAKKGGEGTHQCYLAVQVNKTEELRQFMKAIRQLDNVVGIARNSAV
jgi:GTP pyrophosphokinase